VKKRKNQKRKRKVAKPRPKQTPEVAKRRAIVQANPTLRSQQLVKRFDFDNIRMPPGWDAPSWTAAYQKPEYRPLIQTMVSKDRHWLAR
jgi:hypothetical protein